MIRVTIVGDVRLYREGLASALRSNEDLSVVGTLASSVSALANIQTTHPDVVVVDIDGRDSLEIVRKLQREIPRTRVIAFAVDEHEPDLVMYAQAGAAGYATSDASVDDLTAIIKSVASGEVACSPRVASMLVRRLASPPAQEVVAREAESLTSRESEVLDLICDGLSNKEIADALHISDATVKNHVHHLLEKLHVSTRSRAAARAGVTARSRKRTARARY